MRLGSLLLVLFAWQATSAFGATVVSSRLRDGANTVEFKAASGEANVVSIHVAGGNALIRDQAQRLRMRGGFCVRVSKKSVRCPADLIYALLGDRDDEFDVSAEASENFSSATVEEVDGGSGSDRIRLGYGGIANGGAGHDQLDADNIALARGGILDGGRGSDRVTGSSDSDELTGGVGDDVVHGRGGRDRVSGGGSGHDRLYGGAGPDRLSDQDGGDGPIGPDKLVGGRGRDLVESYRNRQRPVFVNLSRPGADGQRGEDDSLSSIENVWAGAAADTLVGNATGNKIIGGASDDVIRGRGGNDTLTAAPFEADRVHGGGGDDHIRASPAASAVVRCDAGADRVTSTASRPRLQGPLLAPDCERIERRVRGPFTPREHLALDPVPEAIDDNGDMTFTVLEFVCCDDTLELTRPARPAKVVDSAPVDANQLTVTAPADLAGKARTEPITLRAKAGRSSHQLVWRFRVGG